MKLTTFFLVNLITTLTLSIVRIDCQLLSMLAFASLARLLRPRSSFPGSSFYPQSSSSSPYDQMLSSSASHINPVMVPPPSPFSPMSTSSSLPFGFPMTTPSPLMSKNMFTSPVSDWSRLLQPSESHGIPSIYGQQPYPLGGGFPSLPALSSPFSGLASGLTSGYSSGLSSGLPSFSSSLFGSSSPLGSSSSPFGSSSSPFGSSSSPFGLSAMYPFDDYTGQRKRNFRLSPF